MKLARLPDPIRLHLPDFQQVAITLVGCGGTGSHIASGLIAVAQALNEKGIGIDMLFVDPDTVEEKNVGRQLFARADIGQPKAAVLAQRLNLAFGARVGAAIRAIDALDTFQVAHHLNIVIGAVDNTAARKLIANQVAKAKGRLWWLDCGNENHSGQVALGNCAASAMRGSVALGMIDRLPAPHIVYPDLVKMQQAKAPRRRASCAELAAAGEQGLMVNRAVAAWACTLLCDFVVAREVRWFALAFDLQWGNTRAYHLDAPTLAEVSGLAARELYKAKRKTGEA